MFSRVVPGTSKRKTKMNWFDYWIMHCWMTGWQSINHSFRNWADLMTGNWKDYGLMFYDDPYEECRDCFWSYLGEDDTLPKEFLEYLQQMVNDVETGKVKTVPFTKEMFDDIDELVGDMIDTVDLKEDLADE